MNRNNPTNGDYLRKLLSITAIAAVAVLAFAPAASAIDNPFVPNKPKKSHYGFKWVNYGCKEGSGQVRAYATANAYVYKLKSKYGMYRQKIKVQIDYNRRTNPNATPDWREVDGSSGTKESWFQKYSTVPGTTLPDAVQLNHNTGMQPSGATLTAKATVWLKRYGFHNAVWRYRKRSPKFTCPDPYGDMLPPTVQPPSVNGGS